MACPPMERAESSPVVYFWNATMMLPFYGPRTPECSRCFSAAFGASENDGSHTFARLVIELLVSSPPCDQNIIDGLGLVASSGLAPLGWHLPSIREPSGP